jgi:hypothetical protein
MAERYGGPIDPYSPWDLYDVVEDNIPSPFDAGDDERTATEYRGMHILKVDDDRYIVQLDGHIGKVMEFRPEDYDDVLELVADLNDKVSRWNEYRNAESDSKLVEWAGRFVTSDKEKAEQEPDKWIHVPGHHGAE